MGGLEHARAKLATAPLKVARDVRSYQVEAAFLRSAACQQLQASPLSPPLGASPH